MSVFINYMKHMNQYNNTHAMFRVFLVVVLSSIIVASSSLMSIYVRWIFEIMMNSEDLGHLYNLSIMLITVFLVVSLLKILQNFLFVKCKSTFTYAIKKSFFDKIQSSTYLINTDNETTDIYYRINSDVSSLTKFYFDLLIELPVGLIGTTLFLAIMFTWSPILTIYIFVLISVQLLVAHFVKKPIGRYREELVKRENEFATEIGKHFRGIELVKLFGLEHLRLLQLQASIDGLIKINVKSTVLISILSFFSGLIGQIGMVGLFVISAMQVISGNMTIGTVFSFYILVGLLSGAISALIELIFAFEKVMVNFRRYEEYSSEYDSYNYDGTVDFKFENELIVKNLSFKYDTSEGYLFEDINIVMKPGMFVGLAGDSGEGKSSFAKLIMKLLKPALGNISIDGVRVEDISNDSYRKNIAYLTQVPFIIDGTLLENVSAGIENIDTIFLDELIDRTGTRSILDSLDVGMDTVIGKGGIRLSIGEAQRIVMIRTLLKKPKIIILDEPTAALNKAYENLTVDLFRDYSKRFNALVIVISHNQEVLNSTDDVWTIRDKSIQK